MKLGELLNGVAVVTSRLPIRKTLKTTTMVLFQRIEFTPEFYTIPSVSSPWLLRSGINYVGNTSFIRYKDINCGKSGALLMRAFGRGVAVDPQSRRPVQIPEEFAKSVNPAKRESPPPRFYFPEFLRDQNPLFSISLLATPSETDDNNHIGYFACYRYCLDGASVAAIQGGVLKSFSKDMAYYNVKSFSVEYRAEIREGDEVNVQCWEDPKNACALYFVVKAGEKTACRCFGEWYVDDSGQPVELNNGLRFLEGAVSQL